MSTGLDIIRVQSKLKFSTLNPLQKLVFKEGKNDLSHLDTPLCRPNVNLKR